MKIFNNKENKQNSLPLINWLDLFLLTIVISYLFYDIICNMSSTIAAIIDYINLDLVKNVTDKPETTVSYNTTIVHTDGTRSDTIRSLFIYGIGAYRFVKLTRLPGG